MWAPICDILNPYEATLEMISRGVVFERVRRRRILIWFYRRIASALVRYNGRLPKCGI